MAAKYPCFSIYSRHRRYSETFVLRRDCQDEFRRTTDESAGKRLDLIRQDAVEDHCRLIAIVLAALEQAILAADRAGLYGLVLLVRGLLRMRRSTSSARSATAKEWVVSASYRTADPVLSPMCGWCGPLSPDLAKAHRVSCEASAKVCQCPFDLHRQIWPCRDDPCEIIKAGASRGASGILTRRKSIAIRSYVVRAPRNAGVKGSSPFAGSFSAALRHAERQFLESLKLPARRSRATSTRSTGGRSFGRRARGHRAIGA